MMGKSYLSLAHDPAVKGANTWWTFFVRDVLIFSERRQK
jgi:hypothetical protein